MEILRNRESVFGLDMDLKVHGVANPLTRRIITTVFEKKSNLCLSADLRNADEILKLCHELGPHIVVLKTHWNIIKNRSPEFLQSLQSLAKEHNFLIFEDCKFFDTGDTIALQYVDGPDEIHDWADLVTASIFFGSACIESLARSRKRPDRGCLVVAEASSRGNFFDDRIKQAALDAARSFPDFVSGFICQSRLTQEPNYLHFTPGVHLESTGTSAGQQYVTPEEAVINRGADIIIVGRGILSSSDRLRTAIQYKEKAFAALKKRIG